MEPTSSEHTVEKLLRQQAALAAFGAFAFHETDLFKILTEAARICALSLGVPFCKVCRYRFSENDLLIEAGCGWKAGVVGRVVSQANETSPQGRAYVTGEPVIIRNLQTANDLSVPDFYPQHGIISTVDVLIPAVDGSPYGVLEVDSPTAHQYDEHDINFLTGFANVLAEAVAMAAKRELLELTLRSIGDGVVTTGPRGRITWLNPVAEQMTGWTSAEAVGRELTEVVCMFHEVSRQAAEDQFAKCVAVGSAVTLPDDIVLISRRGQEYAIADSAAPIRNQQGDMLGVVMVFRDVTERRRLSGETSYRAAHDALTGLVNRAEFDVRLRRMLTKAQAENSQNALLYIDLDQFKIVNDTCGHAVGDKLLVQVAKLLIEMVRGSDTLARLGGDEFAVILDRCSVFQAQRLAHQICERMEDFRFTHDLQRFRINTSIGVVPLDAHWTTTAAILQAADSACYAAKSAGRNCVRTWFETDEGVRTRNGQARWATQVEQALDEGRFVLFFQHIESLDGVGQGVHGEVLLRMIDADGALILPGQFLPAAERFDLASRIDRWVLQQVIGWLNALPSLALVDTLWVNLSGQSVGDRAFHRWAIDLLKDSGPEICGKLCLEITETSAVTNFLDAGVFIGFARAQGARVALDEFGAGASSFAYLKNMPVDFLKIDGQFIRNLLTSPLDAAAVRCFADVAGVVGMKTVAEFVELPEVLDRLREMGIDYAQGYLLHRPVPINAILPAGQHAEPVV